MDTASEIVTCAKKFRGRLPDQALDTALHDLGAGEPALAVETLYDLIIDGGVPISVSEADELNRLAGRVGARGNRITYIRRLVRP